MEEGRVEKGRETLESDKTRERVVRAWYFAKLFLAVHLHSSVLVFPFVARRNKLLDTKSFSYQLVAGKLSWPLIVISPLPSP